MIWLSKWYEEKYDYEKRRRSIRENDEGNMKN